MTEHIATLITYLPDDESYEGRWALTKMAGAEAAMAADEALISEASEFERKRKEARLSSWSFGQHNPALRVLGKVLLALVFLPCFLFAAIAAAPLWLVGGHIARGLKDQAFARTARFGVKLAGTPLMVIVWTLVFFLCLPWKPALIAFILATMSHRFFYASLNFARILLSDIRLLFGHKELKDTYARLSNKVRTLSTTNHSTEI